MEYQKESWEIYKERLISYEYTEEQIAEVEKIRTELEYMSPEQFDFLVKQGVIKRTAKLKKLRSLFTDGEKVYYLNHFSKSYNYCGIFNNE